ncbi:Zinc finger ZZ-type and EF-hand domain-containing protein 1 [Lamellibrachia satsuma]|nr:Zinc finger ZZ-type and EF-hand domain-containing protein 1 [Lamellibrachia satsuma]
MLNVQTEKKPVLDEDNDSDGDVESEKDSVPSFDLGALFEHTSLRSAATKVISDDVPESVIHQHHTQLVRWLRERQARNEDVITLSQFCNSLADSWDGRDACIQAFQQFDSEGDGTADVGVMLEALRMSDKMNTYKELDYVVRTLQACPLTPGFIDVYNDEKVSVGEHGARILQFLLRNRAPSNMLPFPVLNSFNNTMQMRLSALKSHFSQLKETANTQQEESALVSGEEMQPITKCFSSLEVSTNRGDANRLTNTDFSSYWQSNGSARSHWIRLRIKNNVVIRQLCVGVAASDQSYMPQFITISVGKNCRSQREVKEIRIPSHYTGDIVLFENAKMYYPVVQINIKRCHSDGCDTRIHSVKTIGYRIVKESGVSVMDASASWYLQVLAATTSACIPTAPQLREVIIAHTLEALKHMAPLSLSPSNGENPLFLTPHVLRQMDTFLRTISVDANGRHEADGLRMLLAFNLARGHTAGLLQTLHWLQESRCMELEAASLLKNLDTVRDSWLKKQGKGQLCLSSPVSPQRKMVILFVVERYRDLPKTNRTVQSGSLGLFGLSCRARRMWRKSVA